MTASILHPHQWNKESVQSFLTVAPGRDELLLYESTYEVCVRQCGHLANAKRGRTNNTLLKSYTGGQN